MRRQAAYGIAYITPGMLIFLVFCIAPIFMTVFYSFTEYNLAQPPEWIALENYAKVFTNSQLRRALFNTVIYVIITVPLQTLMAMLVANFLAEYLNNRYGRFLRSIIFIPTLASYVAAASVWEVILASRGGLLNGILGVCGLGLFSTALPYIFYTRGLAGLSPSKASVLAFAEPMVATLVGIFVLHEPITLPAVLGIALIFAGIVVLNRRSS